MPCGTHPTDGFKGCLNSPCFEGYLKIGQSLFSSAETRPCSARHSFQVAFLRCLAGNQAYGKVGFAALVFKKADVVAVGLAAGADGPHFAHLQAAVHFVGAVDFAVYGFDIAAVERGGFGGAHDFEHVVAQDVVAAESGAFAAEGLVAEAGAGGKGEGGEEGEEFAHGIP